MNERLDVRAQERIRGPAWDKIRSEFDRIHESLIAVSSSASGELTTIYVKYTTAETGSAPYAVLWIKKSTELVLGLALPIGYETGSANVAAITLKYTGLTTYLKFNPGDEVPDRLREWADEAYKNVIDCRQSG